MQSPPTINSSAESQNNTINLIERKPSLQEKKQHTLPKPNENISTQAIANENNHESQILNIDITNEQIENIEQNISDLQKDVKIFKDSKGWVVKFYRNENLISSLGINDNDIIRFDQLNRLKADPSKEHQISQLESIFYQLER